MLGFLGVSDSEPPTKAAILFSDHGPVKMRNGSYVTAFDYSYIEQDACEDAG